MYSGTRRGCEGRGRGDVARAVGRQALCPSCGDFVSQGRMGQNTFERYDGEIDGIFEDQV